MSSSYRDILQSAYQPLEPIPTGESAVLAELAGIRAVLFDLYGTLFISDSGEVDAEAGADHRTALAEAMEAINVRPTGLVDQALQYRRDLIESLHAESRRSGIEYPEVDIVEVWRGVLAELARRGAIPERAYHQVELERLAVEYEARANPVWPMPGLRECLSGLRRKGLELGIISNAQFYSLELFPALLGGRAEDWGFSPSLQYYSYQYGRAKPGLELHRMAAEELGRRQIEPREVLYVGNDMLNDVLPASRLGFRTALFAGDARSLRRRVGEPRLDGLLPDVVVTNLAELNSCV